MDFPLSRRARGLCSRASGYDFPTMYRARPARACLGEAEKTPCGLGPCIAGQPPYYYYYFNLGQTHSRAFNLAHTHARLRLLSYGEELARARAFTQHSISFNHATCRAKMQQIECTLRWLWRSTDRGLPNPIFLDSSITISACHARLN